MAEKRNERGENVKKKKPKYKMKENLAAGVFILPGLIPLLMFWIGPVFYSAGLSFTDWDMISEEINFVGLDNYKNLLTDPEFYRTLKNTLLFTVGNMIPTIVLGVLAALVLCSIKRGGFIKTILFSPYITPMVAVSIVWSWIFEPRVGILNYVFSVFGLPGLEWLQSSDTAMLSIVIVTVWKQIGWAMLFYVDAIKKVLRSMMEAASIDGAGVCTTFTKIIWPTISPTTFFLIMITTINSIQAYDQIQVLTQGGPAGATRTLLYYFYMEGFEAFNTGKASAVAVIIILITAVLSIGENIISKKHVHYDLG